MGLGLSSIGSGAKRMSKLDAPKLGIDSINEEAEQNDVEPLKKHSSVPNSTKNMMFGKKSLLKVPDSKIGSGTK